MTRHKKDLLRELTADERSWLARISRSQSEPYVYVTRAKIILAVADGKEYGVAALEAGRKTGDAVSRLVSDFNRRGMAALEQRHSGGPAAREHILAEVRRKPDPATDGTATWSLQTLQRALRQAPDGLPEISEYTIRQVLLEAGYSWQQARTWCTIGQVLRKRKSGTVVVTDPDAEAKKAGQGPGPKLDRRTTHQVMDISLSDGIA